MRYESFKVDERQQRVIGPGFGSTPVLVPQQARFRTVARPVEVLGNRLELGFATRLDRDVSEDGGHFRTVTNSADEFFAERPQSRRTVGIDGTSRHPAIVELVIGDHGTHVAILAIFCATTFEQR